VILFDTTPLAERRDVTPVLQSDIDRMREELSELYEEVEG
jgi:hypothetical protein